MPLKHVRTIFWNISPGYWRCLMLSLAQSMSSVPPMHMASYLLARARIIRRALQQHALQPAASHEQRPQSRTPQMSKEDFQCNSLISYTHLKKPLIGRYVAQNRSSRELINAAISAWMCTQHCRLNQVMYKMSQVMYVMYVPSVCCLSFCLETLCGSIDR